MSVVSSVTYDFGFTYGGDLGITRTITATLSNDGIALGFKFSSVNSGTSSSPTFDDFTFVSSSLTDNQYVFTVQYTPKDNSVNRESERIFTLTVTNANSSEELDYQIHLKGETKVGIAPAVICGWALNNGVIRYCESSAPNLWKTATINYSGNMKLWNVAFGAGKYVVSNVYNSSPFLYSEDGINYFPSNYMSSAGNLQWCNDRFIVTGGVENSFTTYNTIAYSLDGIQFTQVVIPTVMNLYSKGAFYDGEYYHILLASTNTMANHYTTKTKDFIAWEPIKNISLTGQVYSFKYFNGYITILFQLQSNTNYPLIRVYQDTTYNIYEQKTCTFIKSTYNAPWNDIDFNGTHYCIVGYKGNRVVWAAEDFYELNDNYIVNEDTNTTATYHFVKWTNSNYVIGGIDGNTGMIGSSSEGYNTIIYNQYNGSNTYKSIAKRN